MKFVLRYPAAVLGIALSTLTAAQSAQAKPHPANPGNAAAGARTAALPAGSAAHAHKTQSPGSRRANAGGGGKIDTSACSAPPLTRALAADRDSHWYTLAPGEGTDNFTGSGWTLTGGAQIITTRLADGHTGAVLHLPSGAQAISPAICVTSGYPAARTMLRTTSGSGGLLFSIALAGTRSWTAPTSSGQRHGKRGAWTLTNRINLHPPHTAGWHLIRINLSAQGRHANVDLYNLYIDPRARL